MVKKIGWRVFETSSERERVERARNEFQQDKVSGMFDGGSEQIALTINCIFSFGAFFKEKREKDIPIFMGEKRKS